MSQTEQNLNANMQAVDRWGLTQSLRFTEEVEGSLRGRAHWGKTEAEGDTGGMEAPPFPVASAALTRKPHVSSGKCPYSHAKNKPVPGRDEGESQRQCWAG